MEKQESNGNGKTAVIVPQNHAAAAVNALLSTEGMESAEDRGEITCGVGGAMSAVLSETHKWSVEDRKALAVKCVSKVLTRALTERAIKAGLIDAPMARK